MKQKDDGPDDRSLGNDIIAHSFCCSRVRFCWYVPKFSNFKMFANESKKADGAKIWQLYTTLDLI